MHLVADFIHYNRDLNYKNLKYYFDDFWAALTIWSLFMLPWLYFIYMKPPY